MYVYELARELGSEPREIIECAAVEGIGHVAPNTVLTQEQILVIRESYTRSAGSARGSLFAGGAAPAVPATAPPPPPPAPAAGSYDSPLLPYIHDPDAPVVGGGAGQPLSFDPGATASSYAPPASAPAAARAEPSWDPLPPLNVGAPPVTYGSPAVAPTAPIGLTEAEYESQYRPDDWKPQTPEAPTVTRSVVIGVVGLLVIVLSTMFIGRSLGIIGPGAERHCVITNTPVVDGEGEIEELLCVDGYGKEVRREVRVPEADTRAITFGATADGVVTRVVDGELFCRGATDFLAFREDLLAQVAAGPSMVEVGRWYEEHDGFGIAGVSNMVDSFGNAGPNPAVVELRAYLDQAHSAARSAEVPQAQMALGAAEAAHGEQILGVRNFRNSNC